MIDFKGSLMLLCLFVCFLTGSQNLKSLLHFHFWVFFFKFTPKIYHYITNLNTSNYTAGERGSVSSCSCSSFLQKFLSLLIWKDTPVEIHKSNSMSPFLPYLIISKEKPLTTSKVPLRTSVHKCKGNKCEQLQLCLQKILQILGWDVPICQQLSKEFHPPTWQPKEKASFEHSLISSTSPLFRNSGMYLRLGYWLI